MNNKLFIILAFFSILISCGEQEVVVPEVKEEVSIFSVWKRQKIERNYESETEENLAKQKQGRDHKDFYINIFPDGKGSIIYNTEIDTFVWVVNENEGDTMTSITANLPLGQAEIKLLKLGDENTLMLSTDNGKTKMYFKKHASLTSNYKEDPFYPYNNLWRIRKLDLLTAEELDFKVDNYLQHYAYLFKAALDKENPRNFSNFNSKGVLRVYKSSIGIAQKHEIDEDWYSYFYNEKEAEMVYDLIKNRIKGKSKKLDKSEDWISDNYEILSNIIGSED